uniref:Putative secreted protein n=1 Tax=Amblyomma triste TaxID=251400 RepID=A0A023G8Y1_AMBTT
MKIACFITVLLFAATGPISAAANQPQPRTTVACVPPYRGKGYARSYNFKCKLRTGTYPNNTPCLPVTGGGRPLDQAGLCQHNRCKPFYKLHPLLKVCVFPRSLHRCPDKENTKKIVLDHCHYYCKQTDKEWYFGHYKNEGNSACHLEKPDTPYEYGECCRGQCVKRGQCSAK